MSATNRSGRTILNIGTTARKVNSSAWTVRRWSKKPELGFPEPIVIENRLFWFEDEIDEWMQSRPRLSEQPPDFQKKKSAAMTTEAA
ncbi:MAG: helix-turn-helix transcriptional regulator [Methyloceanibacter sp.]